jgi:hypothetical protein
MGYWRRKTRSKLVNRFWGLSPLAYLCRQPAPFGKSTNPAISAAFVSSIVVCAAAYLALIADGVINAQPERWAYHSLPMRARALGRSKKLASKATRPDLLLSSDQKIFAAVGKTNVRSMNECIFH